MTIDILMIDDQQDDVLKSVINRIEKEGYRFELHNFESMEEILKQSTHKIIILDYFEGGKEPGLSWLENIWNDKFRPIIFHSARAEEVQSLLFENGYQNHPLINVTKKGSRSFQNLIKLLNYSQTIVNQIEEYDEAFNEKFWKIKQDTIKYTFQFLTMDILSANPGKFDSIINRRLANFLEKQNQDILEPFEMYIYPPVGDSLMVGDILEDVENNEFYAVLTPSCDLVERKGVAEKVHVAKLETINTVYSAIGYQKNYKNIISALKSKILNNGYSNGIVPLPPLINAFSSNMVINLKNCFYIDRQKIGFSKNEPSAGQNYVRIASIDSPFSEMIVWAYMSVSCRPGLPDRNVDLWANSIHSENTKEAT